MRYHNHKENPTAVVENAKHETFTTGVLSEDAPRPCFLLCRPPLPGSTYPDSSVTTNIIDYMCFTFTYKTPLPAGDHQPHQTEAGRAQSCRALSEVTLWSLVFPPKGSIS